MIGHKYICSNLVAFGTMEVESEALVFHVKKETARSPYIAELASRRQCFKLQDPRGINEMRRTSNGKSAPDPALSLWTSASTRLGTSCARSRISTIDGGLVSCSPAWPFVLTMIWPVSTGNSSHYHFQQARRSRSQLAPVDSRVPSSALIEMIPFSARALMADSTISSILDRMQSDSFSANQWRSTHFSAGDTFFAPGKA